MSHLPFSRRAAGIPTFVLLLCQIVASAGQADETRFETTSVRPSTTGAGRSRSVPGHFTFRDRPLSFYITEAYGIFPYQLMNAPDWIFKERYDIEGTLPGRVLLERTMLSTGETRFLPAGFLEHLLEDRFALRVRIDTRLLSIYRLEWARADRRPGPGLKTSTANCRPPQGEVTPCRNGGTSDGYFAIGMRWAGPLLGVIRSETQRDVVDETGLSGDFDVSLKWTRDLGATTRSDNDYVSFYTAMEEQLGLRLVKGEGPVRVVVIERVERPSPN